MANIYELKSSYLQLQNAIENGEEDLTSILETVEDAVQLKCEGYAKVITNLESDVDGLKAEEKRISEKRKDLEKKIGYLKTIIYETMKETKLEKFKTNTFNFAIVKNGGKTPIVVDVECSELPDDLVKIDEKPDLEAIRDYIERTGDISYAHFGERGESLRIK